MNLGMKTLQQLQQQQQKQQQEQLRRMQMAAYARQKEEKRRQKAQAARKEAVVETDVRDTGLPQLDDRFRAVEAEVARLNQQFAAGQLNQTEMNTKLEGLKVQDDQGRWWVMGAATSQWYVFDGQNWIVGDPSGRAVRTGTTTATNTAGNTGQAVKQHRFSAVVVTVLLGLLFLMMMGAMGNNFVVRWLIAGLGLIVIFFSARRLWRGY
jgi:hypothetical protein